MAFEELRMGAAGTSFTDSSIASLSSLQAAGTSSVLPTNVNRKSLKIVPPADCVLTLTAGSSAGIPLFAGVPNTLAGGDCPTNALYVTGLVAGNTLVIWEG